MMLVIIDDVHHHHHQQSLMMLIIIDDDDFRRLTLILKYQLLNPNPQIARFPLKMMEAIAI